MGLAKPSLRKTPDLGFFKLMGTGSGAGFSTRPNFGVYTLLAEWPSMEIARERIDSADRLEGTAGWLTGWRHSISNLFRQPRPVGWSSVRGRG
jgi:hypothetical protein